MVKPDVYVFVDYKEYLNNYLRSLPKAGHGFRTKIAEATDCRLSYVSEVLNKAANFNLEQAESLNQLLQHDSAESDYFLLLVNYERAGSKILRTRYFEQIRRAQEKRMVLKDRLNAKEGLSAESQAEYYSSWHYAAIHILVSLSHLQTKDALSAHLNLPKERVAEVLDFLVGASLLKFEAGRYSVGVGRIFLGNESPNIIKHHTNWRLRAIESLDRRIKDDLHYSSVVSLRKSDVLRAKEVFVKAIEAARAIVRESPEDEEVHVFSVDLFKI